MTIEYKPEFGDRIEDVEKKATVLANQQGETVSVTFDGMSFDIHPGCPSPISSTYYRTKESEEQERKRFRD